MKRFRMLAAAGVMATMGNVALASTGSLTQFRPQVMPVLVHVNSHGDVTEVSPSIELTPVLKKLLATSLDNWINEPGKANGRPVATVLIVNVALKTEPRADGNYDAKFAYVSSSASPFFSAHWASINGHELALVDNTGGSRENRNAISHQDYNLSINPPSLNHQSPNAIQSNSQSTATSSPPKSH